MSLLFFARCGRWGGVKRHDAEQIEELLQQRDPVSLEATEPRGYSDGGLALFHGPRSCA